MKSPLLATLVRNGSVRVLVIDNLGEHGLRQLCESLSIGYLENDLSLGFAANNNKAYSWFYEAGDVSPRDYFVCCNPDIEISDEELDRFVCSVSKGLPEIASINLFRDREFSSFDSSIRHFPRLTDYFFTMAGYTNPACIDRSRVSGRESFDWAAGSFLVFSMGLFQRLGGFDERYYMYFEDVDICLRAWREHAVRVRYFPEIRAFHSGGFRNRSIISRHFCWYLKSFLRFHWAYYFKGRRPIRHGVSKGS